MQEALKTLRQLLTLSELAAHAEVLNEKTRATAIVRHPNTGERACFSVTVTNRREPHAIKNQLSRMRRFHRIGHDLRTGQAY